MSEPEEGGGRSRGSPRALVSNWRDYDASFWTKTRLAARNYWIRLRTRSACCGNHGQPGC